MPRTLNDGIMTALGVAGYRVIAFDNRGHGLSDKPHDGARYGLEMVRDVVRLLDPLNVDRAHVVGYSLGAVITNNVRALYPERLITATLGGAGLHTMTTRRVRTATQRLPSTREMCVRSSAT